MDARFQEPIYQALEERSGLRNNDDARRIRLLDEFMSNYYYYYYFTFPVVDTVFGYSVLRDQSNDFFKVNVPVCDPVSVCVHFLIFLSIDEANDKKTVR